MMEVRRGAIGGTSSSCRPNLVMASPCATSALYFLAAERTPLSSQRSCTLLDQRRSASAASHCSTSGTLHPHAFGIPSFWSKSPCHERRRQGKCNFASEGSSSSHVSVAGSVAVMESVLEVMEWRSRSSQQLQDPRRDSEEVTESQNYPVDAAEIELEPAAFEKSSGLETEGTPLEEPLGGKEVEGSAYDEQSLKQMGAPRGWRGLASGDGVTKLNPSKAFLLKRPWRKSNSKRQRFRSADNYSLSSSPPREEYKLVGTNRDASLEELFKSLASPRASVPSGAIERYFGRELSNSSVSSRRAEMAAETTSALEGFSSGNTVETDSTASQARSFNLPGRLKINLDLDLYRASCLRQERRLDEAEAILKECVRDWPDDGRAYLSLGLLALPLNNDQVNRVDGNTLNEKNVSGLEKYGLFPGDYFTYEDVGDGAAKASGTVPWSPVVSGGERLKINLDLQLYHAKCLKQKGRRNASETVLRKCIKDWPDDGRSYVALGKLLLDQNRIQDARTVYDSGCQAVRGENPYIWQAPSSLSKQLVTQCWAPGAFFISLPSCPWQSQGNAASVEAWAILEEKCGDISNARKLFDAAIVADKKHVSAWHGWAKLELRAGNLKKARSLLNKGLKSCGSNEYIFQTLALLEMGEGKVEEARSLLSKATIYNPKSAASWLAWALMEAENNFPDTARALFQKGVEASPKNRYVWQAWAGFESRQGREERARELFQRGRELNPKDVVILQAYALFEYACGRPGIARDIFRRAVACDSKHQPVLIAWGWMEWKEGNLSVAREFYQGAIQVDSRSLDAARAFQAWGTLEDREGDTGLARELFKCALKIDSQNIPTWMSWAAMEDREGRFDRADEIRNQYLQERTEVVEAPWDVDITDILAPAIDHIKGFFKGGRRSSSSRSGSNSSDNTDLSPTGSNEGVDVNGVVRSIDSSSAAEEFDVDSFLKKKFPFKYGFLEEGEPLASNSVQEPTKNDRF